MSPDKKPHPGRRDSGPEKTLAAAQPSIDVEERLQADLDYAQSIIDTIREPMLVLDEALRVRTASRSFCRAFQVDRAETEGRLLYELGEGQWGIPTLRALLEEILKESSSFDDFKVDHEFPRIGRRVMLLNARKVWSEGNYSASILLAIDDVTEQHRAESERRRLAELNQRLLDSTPDCIKILDLDARLLSMSANGMRALCIPDLTPHLGSDWRDFWKGQDREAAAKAVEIAKRGGSATFEGLFATLQGDERWWHVAVSPVLGDANEPEFLLSVSRDITERKTMEKALEQANAAWQSSSRELKRSNEDLEQFARVAAHDLRAPLSTIVRFSQLLVRRHRDSSDQETQQCLTFIEEGGRRMSALIDDLMRYAVATQAPAALDIVHASVACNTAIANLTTAIENTGAAVHCQISDQVKVKANLSLLVQVFQNLIANAIHYRREGVTPQVALNAHTQGAQWLFSVEDNGIGIEAKNLESIFEPFCRLHGADRPGSGIGLATCKHVIERAAGTIWVDSDIGKGSTFFFRLPQA